MSLDYLRRLYRGYGTDQGQMYNDRMMLVRRLQDVKKEDELAYSITVMYLSGYKFTELASMVHKSKDQVRSIVYKTVRPLNGQLREVWEDSFIRRYDNAEGAQA